MRMNTLMIAGMCAGSICLAGLAASADDDTAPSGATIGAAQSHGTGTSTYNHSGFVALLPYIEQPTNGVERNTVDGTSNTFAVGERNIRDGLSNTVMFAEKQGLDASGAGSSLQSLNGLGSMNELFLNSRGSDGGASFARTGGGALPAVQKPLPIQAAATAQTNANPRPLGFATSPAPEARNPDVQPFAYGMPGWIPIVGAGTGASANPKLPESSIKGQIIPPDQTRGATLVPNAALRRN